MYVHLVSLFSPYVFILLCVVFQLNALANRAAGKGYESTDFYDNVKFQFVGIENIHVMRQSLQKLIEGTVLYKEYLLFFPEGFNLFTPKLKKFILPVVCHLSKLWKAKFFILCVAIIYLVRLQGKFNIDHSWEWKVLVDVGWSIVFMSQVFGWSLLLLGALCFFFVCVFVCYFIW